MRVLNLAVVICVGGVLAALPFRLHQKSSQPTQPPARATGPTASQSHLFGETGHLFGESSDLFAGPSPRLEPASPAASDDLKSLTDLVAYDPPPPPPGPSVRRPPMNLPLTYEDLAVPVQPTETMRQRFDAVAKYAQPPAQNTQGQTQRPVDAPPRMPFGGSLAGVGTDAAGDDITQGNMNRVDSARPHAPAAEATGVQGRTAATQLRPTVSGAPMPSGNVSANAGATFRDAMTIQMGQTPVAPSTPIPSLSGSPGDALAASPFATSKSSAAGASNRPNNPERERHWIRQP
ncbi:hypothetical protein [Crateriforma conspicua]|uniref:Uncharacterized protein n=1 Tax=Crateriforma conspicua TaxID=2527996 RepID=A0A5C5Y4P1_9PLAN|nr:hypothetical protein [Crateriforma conspicua]TWT69285.1 hypothetical protein Pan14r_15700 [Crateriforma conspicua]